MDYSTVSNLAQWKLAEINYGAVFSGSANTLTAASEYPQSGTDPQPFDDLNVGPYKPNFFWHYIVSNTVAGTHLFNLTNLYRVDLAIYALDDQTNPIGTFVTYVEKPDTI